MTNIIFPFKQRYDHRRQEVPVHVASDLPDIRAEAEQGPQSSARPADALPMPDAMAPDDPDVGDIAEPAPNTPADPNEPSNTLHETAESPQTPKSKVDAADIGNATPTTIKPLGHRKAMTVKSVLLGPMNRKIYYVDGGAVVSDEFSRNHIGTKRPPHITPSEWDFASHQQIRMADGME
jgi:hypothetical protein